MRLNKCKYNRSSTTDLFIKYNEKILDTNIRKWNMNKFIKMNILLEYQGVKEKIHKIFFRRNQTKEVKQETIK